MMTSVAQQPDVVLLLIYFVPSLVADLLLTEIMESKFLSIRIVANCSVTSLFHSIRRLFNQAETEKHFRLVYKFVLFIIQYNPTTSMKVQILVVNQTITQRVIYFNVFNKYIQIYSK